MAYSNRQYVVLYLFVLHGSCAGHTVLIVNVDELQTLAKSLNISHSQHNDE